jgi:hypothetical protein
MNMRRQKSYKGAVRNIKGEDKGRNLIKWFADVATSLNLRKQNTYGCEVL